MTNYKYYIFFALKNIWYSIELNRYMTNINMSFMTRFEIKGASRFLLIPKKKIDEHNELSKHQVLDVTNFTIFIDSIGDIHAIQNKNLDDYLSNYLKG